MIPPFLEVCEQRPRLESQCPLPHSAVWGARVLLWGGQGPWKDMLAPQAQWSQELALGGQVPSVLQLSAPLASGTPFPITGVCAPRVLAACLGWPRR